MKRRALIIGSPDKDIPGVYDDMKNYRAFLKSFGGGAWYEQEIITLESPTTLQLNIQLELLKSADYSFLVFAGHGGYSEYRRATMLHLNPSTQINENDLKVGAPKRTVIFDACRVLIDKKPLREAMAKSVIALDNYRSLDQSRNLFERSIDDCHPGIAILYGCNIGESAGDIEGIGGRYSAALLEIASGWANFGSNQVGTALSISDAHNETAKLVSVRSGTTQNPKAEFPRTVPRFPLAVKASY